MAGQAPEFDGGGRGLRSTTALIIANTLSGSALGFLFWFEAAHLFTSGDLGIGAAFVALITLVATVADLGMGIVAIRYVPNAGVDVGRLINAMFTIVALAAVALALLSSLTSELWSGPSSVLLRAPELTLLVCASTVFSLAQVADKVLIALDAAHMMLAKNTLSGLLRVAILPLLVVAGPVGFIGSLGLAGGAGLGMTAIFLKRRIGNDYRVRPTLNLDPLRSKVTYTIGNHLSVLAWSAPALVYPFVVISLLGPEANGRFYISWMLANLVYVVPVAASTAWFSRASSPGRLGSTGLWGMTAATLGVLAALVLPFGLVGPALLKLFGDSYKPDMASLLTLLLLASFPFAINSALLFYHRLSHRPSWVIFVSCSIALLCLTLAAWFGRTMGLPGIGLGWLAGQGVGVMLSLGSYSLARRSMAG